MLKLAAKQFEEEIIYRIAECEESAGRATIVRYGVSASPTYANRTTMQTDYHALAQGAGVTFQQAQAIARAVTPTQMPGDNIIWQPYKSLPDFDILLAGGRQCVTDAKVCSQASFPLDEYKADNKRSNRRKQLEFMYKRARFGAITFLLIHFNPRPLKMGPTEAKTFAFPVYRDHPFWQSFEKCEVKRIGEEECAECAYEVKWNIYPGKRKPSPDVYDAITWLAALPFFEDSKNPFRRP